MDIAVVGTGYVGLVSGTCFAEMGVNVTCVDVNEEKINSLLEGNIPIYEPGLDEMVFRNNKEGRLRFTTDITTCLDKVDIVFSAVGTWQCRFEICVGGGTYRRPEYEQIFGIGNQVYSSRRHS